MSFAPYRSRSQSKNSKSMRSKSAKEMNVFKTSVEPEMLPWVQGSIKEYTELQKIVRENKTGEFENWLMNHPTPNVVFNDYNTPIFVAARYGRANLMNRLLDEGAYPGPVDSYGSSSNITKFLIPEFNVIDELWLNHHSPEAVGQVVARIAVEYPQLLQQSIMNLNRYRKSVLSANGYFSNEYGQEWMTFLKAIEGKRKRIYSFGNVKKVARKGVRKGVKKSTRRKSSKSSKSSKHS